MVISANPNDWEKIATAIVQCNLRPVRCTTLCSARALLARQMFSAVLCSDLLPDGDFRALFQVMAEEAVDVPVIVLSHLDDWDSYLKAVRAGAFDYISCPPDTAESERILRLAVEESFRRSGMAGAMA